MVALIQNSTDFVLSPTLATSELVAAKRARGEQVMQMGFGESPFPVPERLQEALHEAAGRREYMAVGGMDALCAAVKGYYKDRVGLDTERYDVLIAPGSKLILYALQMAIAGDLIMPVPSWVSYGPQAKMLHMNVVKVPVNLSDAGYVLEPDVLRQHIHDARAQGRNPSKLVLNYPNNPTGLNMPDDNLQALAALCREEDIFIISDEIYGYISASKSYQTIAKYAPEITAISSGLSKHLSLGGWRVGIGFIPRDMQGLYGLLCSIASETWACVPAPIQVAATEAYAGHADIEKHIEDCRVIHAYMNGYIAQGLREAEIDCPQPQGAFYVYPNFERYREPLAARCSVKTGRDLASYLLEEHNVATLPGAAFGETEDTLTLRVSACDYDGAAVLDAYQAGQVLDADFVAKYAPNVKTGVEAFESFVKAVR